MCADDMFPKKQTEREKCFSHCTFQLLKLCILYFVIGQILIIYRRMAL